MSQGNVARKRYKAMDHRGDLVALGDDCTMGHQNNRPAARKDMSSKPCTQ
jgi:hypothetical protein